MAIEDQIEQLESGIESSYEKVEAKGGTIPAHKNVDNLAGAIDSITIPPEPTGTLNITANGDYDVKSKASAHVDVPSGITPTGTISITDNGQVDVTQYATADVNVSGGGGGIPDQDISFVDIIPASSSSVTSQTISDLDGKTVGDLHMGFSDYEYEWNNRTVFPTAFDSDGWIYLPVTINNTVYNFRTFGSLGGGHSLDTNTNAVVSLKYSGYIPVRPDFTKATLWSTTNATTKAKLSYNGYITNITGQLYVVPENFLNPWLTSQGYYKKITDSNSRYIYATAKESNGVLHNGLLTTTGSYVVPARDAAAPEIGNFLVQSDPSSTDFLFIVFGTAAAYSGDTTGVQSGAAYIYIFVKDGHTISEVSQLYNDDHMFHGAYQQNFYKEEGGAETQVKLDTIPQDPSLVSQWNSLIATDPSALSFSVDTEARPRLSFSARVNVSYTKKLSELVGNLTTATFNITDSQTYTTRTFQGVVLAEQGVDLTDISPLSHGGYYY